MSDNKKDRDAESHASAHFAHVANRGARAAADELHAGAARIEECVQRHGGASLEQKAGRVAEEWHAATLNADAASKGLSVRAHTTASVGRPCAPADIVVTGGGAPIQVKYHATPESNAAGLSRPRYDAMQKVVPAGQADTVRAHAARRADALQVKRPARALSMKHTAATANERVVAGGAESKPLSAGAARELAQDPATLNRMATGAELRGAAKSGAMAGAVVGAAFSVVGSVKDVASGKASVGDAAVRTAQATAVGAATGAGAAVIATATARALTRAGMHSLARNSAPVAVASTVLEIAGGAVSFARGRETARDFGVKSAKAVGRGAGCWAAAEVGALVGTAICPGIGTAVGGLVGGLLAGFGLSKLL